MEETVTITPAAEATGAAKPAMSMGQLVALKPPRLPYHEAVEERFGIDRAGWKALVEAIYPNAETADGIKKTGSTVNSPVVMAGDANNIFPFTDSNGTLWLLVARASGAWSYVSLQRK